MAKQLKHVRFNPEARTRLEDLAEKLDRPTSEIVRALVEPEIGCDDRALSVFAQLVRDTARELGPARASA